MAGLSSSSVSEPEAEGLALARDTTLWTDMLISNIRELPNGIAGKQG